MEQNKLLLIINHMDWFWSHRLPLAQGAKEAGWDVHVCAGAASNNEKLEKNGYSGVGLPRNPLAIIFQLWRILGREKPAMVHVITLKYAFMAGLASRFYPKLRIVHTIAGLGYLFSGQGFLPVFLRFLVGPFLKFALRHPRARIIFQNPDDQALMIEQGFVRSSQVHLIRGSGVDLNEFKHVPEPANTKPVVIMTTRLIREKGVAIFVEAAKLVNEKGVEAVFKIAGGAVDHNPNCLSTEDMKSLIQDSPVEWLGKVDDMPSLYAEANLIVYPSYYGEGIPKVLLEAAATGRCIITTDHPGCREAILDGKTGMLVPVKDVEKTAAAMQELLKESVKRNSMGQAARTYAAECFDVNLVVAQTIAVYDKALAS